MTNAEIIKKAQYSNVIKKAKDGKVLTDREMAIIEEFEQQHKQNSEQKAEKNPLIVSVVVLAGFFRVSTMTLTNWQKMGMPKMERGKYSLQDCFEWWQENVGKPSTQKEEKARERYWQAKADREELAVAELKNAVIKKSDLIPMWTARIQEIARGLESQEYIFPSLLIGKNAKEMAAIIADYNFKLRSNYARDGKYTPVKEYEAAIKPTKKSVKSKAKTKGKTKPKKSAK